MIRFLLKLHSCIIALLAGSEYMGCFNTPLFSHLDATLDFRLNCVGNEAHSGFYFFLFRCRYWLLAGAFNCSCFGRHSGPRIILFHRLLSVSLLSVVCCMCLLSVVYACCPLYVVRYHSIGCCLWNKSSPPLGNPSTQSNIGCYEWACCSRRSSGIGSEFTWYWIWIDMSWTAIDLSLIWFSWISLIWSDLIWVNLS